MVNKIKNIFLFIALLLGLNFLGGCAVYKSKNPFILERRALPNKAEKKENVSKFFDQQHLTLQNCIALGLKQNHQIGALSGEVEKSFRSIQISSSQGWPEVKIHSGFNRYVDNQRIVTFRRPGDVGLWSKNIVSTDLVISMPIYTGGKITNEIEASKLLYLSASHHLSRTRREVVFNITAVFYSLLKLKKVVEALNFSQKTLVLHKKNVIHLLENQKVTRVALLRTEARIESLKAEIVKTLNTMAIQRQILANLMGIAQRVHFRIQGKLDRVKTDLNLKIHPTKAFSHRHDYLRLISELNRDKRLLNIAESANYPTLALTGVYGANWGIGHTIRQPGANEIEDHGQIGLSLTYPLFQGGKVMSTIARAKSSIQIIQHKIKGLELQIRLEITRAVLNIKSSLARIKASRRAMDAARESLRLIREKYALGKGTVVEVLDAQNDLLNVQVDYYQALADYNIGLSQFKLSLGGN